MTSYVIKVKNVYLAQPGMWDVFCTFIENAKQYASIDEAECAVDELLDDNYYHNFGRKDIKIIPYERV